MNKTYQTIISSLYLKSILFSYLLLTCLLSGAQGVEGYYRFPTIYDNKIVFTAEGDLWVVNAEGGLAQRLTTHLGEETHPVFSPDGKRLAFTASYEGQQEVYTIPAEGGTPQRWTYQAESSTTNCWTPTGELIYATSYYATLPDLQLVKINLETNVHERIPLSQASEASFHEDGTTLYFVRPTYHNNVTKRYKGGTARQIWRYTIGDAEAKKLTIDHPSESYHPMWWNNRIYFITDRTGTMNIWSMDEEGKDLQQHTVQVNDKALYWTSKTTGLESKTHLMALPISNENPEPQAVLEDISSFDLSADGKKILIRKKDDIYVLNAGTSKQTDISKHKVDLSGWTFSINVQEDWQQIFTDAWRMERDYFYDPNMHRLDWAAMYEKYRPLVDRVTTRTELSDLIGRFVGELSALHTSVRGGDVRKGNDQIKVASLGSRLVREEKEGGYRIDYIYKADPDYPDQQSPLAHPALNVKEGDIIEHINGVKTLSVPHIGALLRNQAGKQVRIGINSSESGKKEEVIIVPISNEQNLRYNDWEYSRRMEVEAKGDGKIGYVHLRAMGSRDLSQWYREFYPVFDRQGLIVDVRHNRGGNIESFILEKLMRTAWMYWKSREFNPSWNMQYAFRGHIVALCDERTASDGEAFVEGFKRLGLGKVIGTRTWGGEIWLSSVNRLTDGGIARAPMSGVYGPEGEWLIEGHGFVPDIEIINLPHSTFNGEDAQLDAAIDYLLKEIEKDPREVPDPPAFPDKSWQY